MILDRGDIVKLNGNREGEITSLPTDFMANSHYEVTLTNGDKVWVKEDSILYKIDQDSVDDINNYFEIIYDKNGVHLIPKNLDEIVIDDDNDMLKSMSFKTNGDTKHSEITIHIGDTVITNKEPEKEEEDTNNKKHRII